ncbi:exodeoxyribonuclease III [Candidatus Bipolaricaulota bacterium]
MPFVIATWNVNSIRARLHALLPWLERVGPDVVCLQETKVQDHDFPITAIEEVGYRAAYRGEKTYNGVAILAKTQVENVRFGFEDDGPPDEARLIIGEVRGVPIVNTYVPQGRDVEHPMYDYKLEWFERLRNLFGARFSPDEPLLWLGDLNVAPEPIDVWAPDRLLGHVCFNPEVSEALEAAKSWGFVDVLRKHCRDSGQYTYYDYRTLDGVAEGKGWRIDHILATKPLADRSVTTWIDLEPRRGERPSDHTPLLVEFDMA